MFRRQGNTEPKEVSTTNALLLVDEPIELDDQKVIQDEVTRKQVPEWLCYLALAGVQVAFVVGAVYLKGCLQSLSKEEALHFNPLLFVFFRTAMAGPLLMFWATYATGRALPNMEHALWVVLLGFFLFLNQGLYIMGLNFSGALVATCMQPAIPVFTHLLAVLFRYENSSLQKAAGIFLAVFGAVCMVLRGAGSSSSGSHMLLGNLCLVGNTCSMASYFLVAKRLTGAYAAVSIAGWAHIVSATCLAVTCTLMGVRADAWQLPQALWGPLAFWVLLCSVFAYFTVTWAAAYLHASTVASFQCLQPFVGTLLALLLLHEIPTWWDLGSLGVMTGLLLVTWHE